MATVSSTTSTTSYTTSSSSTSAASSTVDWDGLIEAMVQTKLDKADTIDTKITNNQTKISSYQSLQTLLQDLTTKAKALSNPSGISNQSVNVFAARAGYLTANGDVTASSVVSVDVDSGTQTGTYDLKINQVATAQKVSSGAVASSSDDLGYTGVFTIGTEDGTSASIDVTSDMSLSDLADEINDATSTTGVKATLLKVSDSEYRLVLSTSDTGKTITTSTSSGDDVLMNIGVIDSSGAFVDEIQASQKAIITLDGVQITRDTNDISDVLDGVTFHLYAATPTDTSVSVQVAENLTDIQTAISDFVTSYNALRDFVATQSATASDGTASSDAVLFGDATLRSIDMLLQQDLNTMIDGESLGSIGISFNSDNELEIDSTTLQNALNNNLADVQKVFAFNMTSSSSDIYLLARGSKAPSSFTLDIDVDTSGTVTSASVGGDTSLFTISGTRIVGKDGTAYEGFSFSFSGKSSQSIDITLSYGLAEKVRADSDAVGNATSGTLTSIIANIEDQDTDLATKSDLIRSQAESYRTQLTQRYARIQQQILEANSTISYLELLTSSSD